MVGVAARIDGAAQKPPGNKTAQIAIDLCVLNKGDEFVDLVESIMRKIGESAVDEPLFGGIR